MPDEPFVGVELEFDELDAGKFRQVRLRLLFGQLALIADFVDAPVISLRIERVTFAGVVPIGEID